MWQGMPHPGEPSQAYGMVTVSCNFAAVNVWSDWRDANRFNSFSPSRCLVEANVGYGSTWVRVKHVNISDVYKPLMALLVC